MKKEKSFQDYFPGNSCYGCGPANRYGMHVTKSHWNIDKHNESICFWKIRPKYRSAVSGLHGGTSASLADCHSIWTAVAARYDLEKRPFGSEPVICYVTRRIEVDFDKPIPMDSDVLSIVTKVDKFMEKKGKLDRCILETWIVAKGIICVKAKVIAARVLLSEEVAHGLITPPIQNK